MKCKLNFGLLIIIKLSVVALLLVVLISPRVANAHGDLDERIEEVSELLRSRPTNPQLLFDRGILYEQHGDHDGALADFEKVAALSPHFPGLGFARARSSFGAGRFVQALSALDQIQPPESNRGDVYLWRGRILVKLGQPLRAGTNYTTAFARLERASPDVFIEYSRAIATAGTNHYEMAIAGLDEGIKRVGPVITLNLEALEMELLIGRNDAALARVERMMKTTPNVAPLWKQKGEVLERLNRKLEAISAYSQAIALIEKLPASRRSTEANRELEVQLRAKRSAVSAGLSE